MPDCAMVLLHVCRTDSPIGKSNSSLQSVNGSALKLVTVNRAMNPVCHADVTDNVAAAAAAWATGAMGTPRAVSVNADTAT